MKAVIFPGQGSQFTGMGHDLYNDNQKAKQLFKLANKIIDFDICEVMFYGSENDLKQTNVTQPAIFIHSVITAKCIKNFQPDMVAGHSLGEFSALAAVGSLSFENGLQLVMKRAEAMYSACTKTKSTMAAIIGLDAAIIEETCKKMEGIVVPANYNSHNQIVISGDEKTVEKACEKLLEIGAKRAISLPVSGAFHSPIMNSAKVALKSAIDILEFNAPSCPIYQNVCASPVQNKLKLKHNLIEQLTQPVKWYQTIENMIIDGAKEFIEIGPGNVLTNLNKRINKEIKSTKKLI